jgi:hypothetical protein
MAIMEFVQRFQALQLHRDTGDELIKVGHMTSWMQNHNDNSRISYSIVNILKQPFVMKTNTYRKSSRMPSSILKMLVGLEEKCSSN